MQWDFSCSKPNPHLFHWLTQFVIFQVEIAEVAEGDKDGSDQAACATKKSSVCKYLL